jgi:hypothetical protein
MIDLVRKTIDEFDAMLFSQETKTLNAQYIDVRIRFQRC